MPLKRTKSQKRKTDLSYVTVKLHTCFKTKVFWFPNPAFGKGKRRWPQSCGKPCC